MPHTMHVVTVRVVAVLVLVALGGRTLTNYSVKKKKTARSICAWHFN